MQYALYWTFHGVPLKPALPPSLPLLERTTVPSPSSPPRAARRFRRAVSVLAGYLAVPLLAAVSPLLALPAITATYGDAAWAAIALGQSLGATAGVVAELGWGMSGTQRVARQAPRNRARLFALSLVTKAMVGVPVIGAAAVAAALLAPAHPLEASLVACGAGIGMFAGGWVFIGTMRPRLFLVTEVLPRAVLVAASAVVITAGGPLIAYAAALLLAALSAPVAGAVVLGVRAADLGRVSPRRLLRVLRFQLAALSTNVFSSLYISLGVTVATLGSPHSTLLYASMDRLLRMTQQVMAAPNSLLKGWVGRVVDPAARVERAVGAVRLAAGGGLLAGTTFALGSPVAARLIFSGTVEVPPAAAVLGGLSIAVICTSMASGFVLLVALGRMDEVARSAAAGAVVGIPLILVGSATGGGVGALSGQLAAESVVLAYQLAAAGRALRRRRAAALRGAASQPPGPGHPGPRHPAASAPSPPAAV